MNDQEKHRQAGLKALALAKKAEKIRKKKGLKPIYVGKGVNGEDLSGKKYVIKDGRKSNVNHSEVMKMLKEASRKRKRLKNSVLPNNRYRISKGNLKQHKNLKQWQNTHTASQKHTKWEL